MKNENYGERVMGCIERNSQKFSKSLSYLISKPTPPILSISHSSSDTAT